MRAILQRVQWAEVETDEQMTGRIERGLLPYRQHRANISQRRKGSASHNPRYAHGNGCQTPGDEQLTERTV